MRNPRDVLIIKPSSLGDIVHTLPAVALIKQRWPEARLRWLINPEWAPLLEGHPQIEGTLIFPRSQFRGVAGWPKIPAWALKMRREQRADLVLDFQGLLRSALIAKLCDRGEIAGLSDAREGAALFYDLTADVSGIEHAVDRYLALAATLGIAIDQPLEWPLPNGSRPEAFSVGAPFILLHPFSRGTRKSLPVNDVAAFCDSVAPHAVVVAGRAPEEIPPIANVTNLLNRTSLIELIWLIRQASFVVSVDSGPMHIAAALTPRLLSIHTWSDPRKVGPYSKEAWVWKEGAVFQMKDIARPETHRRISGIKELGQFVQSVI